MDFVDNRVDEGTGTIQGRAVVSNEDAVIYPGMFGLARLIGRKDVSILAIPRNAVNTDQSRRFVYVVSDEGKAQRRYLELGRVLEDDFQVVIDGLGDDERVVINGTQRIRAPDQPVTAVPAGDDGS
jgi:multidrug efflux pump subunit AcrA (membrane-fusion protein)